MHEKYGLNKIKQNPIHCLHYSRRLQSSEDLKPYKITLCVTTCTLCRYSQLTENQKGANAGPRCSVENQKGANAIHFVQQKRPSGSQWNIVEER